MSHKTVLVAMLGLAALGLAACDTMDDDESASALSPAQRAYGVCQPSFALKVPSLQGHWALISEVDDDGHTSCLIASRADSSSEASRAALAECKKEFDSCFVFATSDGLSDWARKVSDSYAAEHHHANVTLSRVGDSGDNEDSDANDSGSGSGDDGPSLGDLFQGIADILNGVTGVVQATQGGGGGGYSGGGSASIPSSNGYSQKGAFDDCARLYGAMGDAAGAKKCADRSTNMETAH